MSHLKVQFSLETLPHIPAAVYEVPTGNVWLCEFISPLVSVVKWKRTPAALNAAGVCKA